MMHANTKAFLDMLAVSEGTFGKGDDGYNIIVGGSTFHDYSRHPNLRVYIPRIKNYSTAAGRYQLLYRYWVAYCRILRLNGFTPDVQDAIALQQIREQGAFMDIIDGRILVAIAKCRNIWASLPGAGYGQHENKAEDLIKAYRKAGGNCADYW
jgi:muramidase (phage lysozyme)